MKEKLQRLLMIGLKQTTILDLIENIKIYLHMNFKRIKSRPNIIDLNRVKAIR